MSLSVKLDFSLYSMELEGFVHRSDVMQEEDVEDQSYGECTPTLGRSTGHKNERTSK